MDFGKGGTVMMTKFDFKKYIKPVPTALAALGILAIGGLAIGSCVPPAPEPAPLPAPAPAPLPEPVPVAAPVTAPAPALAPIATSLMDAPVSPGDWFYQADPSETLAIFGANPQNAELIIRCDTVTKRIGIARAGAVSGPVTMRIRSETEQRTLPAEPIDAITALVAAELPANDPLLTRIAFSKGHFGVETAGLAPIYPPAWPEITRVIEDCR